MHLVFAPDPKPALTRSSSTLALALLLQITGLLGVAACPKPLAPPEKKKVQDAGPPSVGDVFAKSLTGHLQLQYADDLPGLRRRKVLRVILRNNSTSYFLFRGDEMGFEYELAANLAKELGLRLEVVPAKTQRDMVPMLLEGKADLIAVALSPRSERSARIELCQPYIQVTHQVVVRKNRKPEIHEAKDLLHEVVHVRRDSASFRKLRELGQQLGQTIPIAAALATDSTEDLLDKVGSGEIPVTVARSNYLAAELTWRDDIEGAFDLGSETPQAWAVRPNNPTLKRAINGFFRRHHKDLLFNSLYNKYFCNPKRAATLRDQNLRADRGGTLSPFDDLLRASAALHALDWRLLAAQAYQESRFDPRANSWAGAIGVMQIMPSTASQLNLKDPHDPAQNIEAGARYLRQLIDRFPQKLPLKERIRFALAAYNCGYGHVADARRLAQRLGLDPKRWFGHTEKAMLRLSQQRFYQNAKHGYVRGTEPVNYVSQIQTRYDAYVAVIESAANEAKTETPAQVKKAP